MINVNLMCNGVQDCTNNNNDERESICDSKLAYDFQSWNIIRPEIMELPIDIFYQKIKEHLSCPKVFESIQPVFQVSNKK